MKSTDTIERLVEKNRYKASPDAYNKTLHSFMQAVDNYKKQKQTLTESNISRTIIKTAKLAAVVLFIAIIIGLHQFSSSIKGTSIAWADVAKRLEKVKSYKAKAHRVLTEMGKEEPFYQCDILRYFSPSCGSVEES